MDQETALTPEAREALAKFRRLEAEAETAELAFFTVARSSGWTWRLMAVMLDYKSPQAAQARHERLKVLAKRRRQKIPAHLR